MDNNHQKMKIAIIIPVYNEAQVIKKTLLDLKKYFKTKKLKNIDLVVVDDGSIDNSGQLALTHANYLLTHKKNCGLGAALATGIEFAKRNNYDFCVTFDSDGQHDPKDIGTALKKLANYDIVIGSRFIGTHSNMPKSRRLILFVSNLITWLFFGVWTTDSQSGFRGLNKKAIQTIRLKSNRMEVSSEFFGEIKRLSLKFSEIPIHVRYTKYSLSKGQKNINSANVLVKLLYMLSR